jgi:hypothetical protein
MGFTIDTGRLRAMLKRSDRFSGYYNRAMETMPPGEKRDHQNQFLRKIVKYAHRLSPGIREKFRTAGIAPEDIQTIKDLEKVPITEKASLISLQEKDPPFGGLLTTPHNRLRGGGKRPFTRRDSEKAISSKSPSHITSPQGVGCWRNPSTPLVAP